MNCLEAASLLPYQVGLCLLDGSSWPEPWEVSLDSSGRHPPYWNWHQMRPFWNWGNSAVQSRSATHAGEVRVTSAGGGWLSPIANGQGFGDGALRGEHIPSEDDHLSNHTIKRARMADLEDRPSSFLKVGRDLIVSEDAAMLPERLWLLAAYDPDACAVALDFAEATGRVALAEVLRGL